MIQHRTMILCVGFSLALVFASPAQEKASDLPAQQGKSTPEQTEPREAKEVAPAKQKAKGDPQKQGAAKKEAAKKEAAEQEAAESAAAKPGDSDAPKGPKTTIYSKLDSYARFAPWRWIGPANHSGRIVDLAVDPRDANRWYVASASGGVWKTDNHGHSFRRIFGAQQPCTIGDIAIDPTRPDVIWVGTGEGNNQRSSYWGDGIYKSTDGGETWKNVGLPDSHHIGRIVVDPTNGDRVFVAALGHLYTPNRERGLYLTEDSGESWRPVLQVDENVGVVDIAIRPDQPEQMLAATYERRRRAWHFDGAGPGSALWRSSDSGRTWKKVSEGLPSGEIGRIGIAWAASKPGTVFLTVSNQNPRPPRRGLIEPAPDVVAENREWEREQQKEWDVLAPEGSEEEPPTQAGADSKPIGGEVYRSDDAGVSWRKVSTQNVGGTPAYYYGQIRVDPSDEKKLYVLSVPLWVSDDGGKKFRRDGAKRIHVDHHALWIDPENGDHLLLGNDGGLYESWDRGKHWVHHENLPVGQYYAIGVDMADPYRVYGGTQDNGSWCVPSQGPTSRGIRIQDCFKVSGGDGFFCITDRADDNIVYTEYQFGGLLRTDLRTMRSKGIRPRPAKGEAPYRFNWMSPLVVSRHAAGTLYYGGNKLFKSTDRGDNWTAISADLSTRDPQKIAGNVPHCTITMISESPKRAGLLWAGTDDGKLWLTADDGDSWQDLTSKLPQDVRELWVSRIAASHHQEGRCYVTYTGYREDHFAPYVFVTDDYGLTWRSITGDLPGDFPVNVIAESPRNEDLLFVGTENGVFASMERGGTWTPMGVEQLPRVAVHDLLVHPREADLVIGTHGLGMHILDISPLEAAVGDGRRAEPRLVAPQDVLRFPGGPSGGFTGLPRQWRGERPRAGSDLAAWLPAEVKKPRLVVRDLRGRELWSFALTEESGMHVVQWNGMTGASGGRGGLLERIGRRMRRTQSRPLEIGEYRLELEVAGKVVAKHVFRVRRM